MRSHKDETRPMLGSLFKTVNDYLFMSISTSFLVSSIVTFQGLSFTLKTVKRKKVQTWSPQNLFLWNSKLILSLISFFNLFFSWIVSRNSFIASAGRTQKPFFFLVSVLMILRRKHDDRSFNDVYSTASNQNAFSSGKSLKFEVKKLWFLFAQRFLTESFPSCDMKNNR